MSQLYRKNALLRIIAIILTFAFIFTNVGLTYSPAFAAQDAKEIKMPPFKGSPEKTSEHKNKGIGNKQKNVKVAGPNDRPGKPGKEPIEIISKRTKYSKRFLNPDGSFTEEIYLEPQFYLDKAEQKWKKIDNNLGTSSKKAGNYENIANDFKVYFAEQAGANELFSVEKDGKSITLAPIKANSVKGLTKDNEITYQAILPGVDLRYRVQGGAVKEDLILQEKQEQNIFTFELKLAGLRAVAEKDGTIVFEDNEGKKVWNFVKPFMVDSNEKYSSDVKLLLREENSKTYVDVVASQAFLEDPDTKYPVIIDPTVQSVNTFDVARDSMLSSATPNDSWSSNWTLYTGYHSYYGTTRSLVQFNLPSLPAGSKITGATFDAYEDSGSSNSVTVDLFRVNSSWGDNVTWNTQPTTAATYDSFVTNSVSKTYWQWDVTKLVEDWYNGVQANYGLMLKQRNEATSSFKWFSSINRGVNTPKLTVNYTVNEDLLGLESFWTYTKDGINVANGNLVLQGTDLSIPGRGIPINIARTYNSRSKAAGVAGYGWQLNIPQISGTGDGPFTYTDEDGTEHIFTRQTDGSYAGPPGNFLEFTKTANGFTVVDPGGIKMNFDTLGKLTQIYDTQRDNNNAAVNTTSFNYNANGQLTSIVDASGRSANFTYTAGGKISAISYNNGTRTLGYGYDANGNLTSVTNQENKTTTFGYDANKNLTSITDPNGNITAIGYDASDRVSQVTRKITVNGVVKDNITTYSYDTVNTKTTVTDAKNTQTIYDYDSNGNVLEIIEDPTGVNQVTNLAYDEDENIASVTDPKNNTSTFTWEAGKGNLLTSTTPKNETSSFDYDSRNNLVEATDPSNNKDSYGYDSKNNNLFSANAYLQSRASKYDVYGNTLWETSPMAAAENLIINPSMERDYNSDGSADDWNKYIPTGGSATISRAAGGVNSSYGTAISNVTGSAVLSNNRSFVIDPVNGDPQYVLSGYIKTQNLSAKAAFLKIDFFDSAWGWKGQIKTPLLGGTNDWTRVQVAINKNNIPAGTTRIQAGLGMFAATGTAYFDNVQLEVGSTASAYNFVENASFEYDSDNDKIPNEWGTFNLDPAGGEGTDTTKTFSGAKTIKMVGASGVNNDIGQTLSLTGKAGDKLTLSGWSYADNPNPAGGAYTLQVQLSYTDGTSFTFGNDFDPAKAGEWQQMAAQIVAPKDFRAATVFYVFNNQRGNVWFDSARLELGNNLTKYEYSTDNNYVTKVTDAMGNQVTFGYDALGNKTSVSDGLNNRTSYTYDNLNRIKTVTDALAGLTAYEYDGNGNLTKVTDAKNNITQYGYNEFNQVKSITDALNKITGINYTIDGQVSEISYPNGNKVGFGYDALGRPSTVSQNGVNKYSFGYDQNGNRTAMTDVAKSQTTTYGFDANDNLVSVTEANGNKVDYVYDKVGNVKSLTTTVGAGSSTINYSFDAINNLIGVTAGSTKANYSYDENGNVTAVQYGNEVYSLLAYDNAGRLTKVANYKTDGTILNSYSYSYDANSNITNVKFADGRSISYTYDALNRLKTETLLDGSAITYYYDAVGNRTKKEVTKGGVTTTTTYTFDAANQLTGVNGQGYSYDANGNMTSGGGKAYVYDAENRLTQVKNSSGAVIASYEYDALGRRTSKTVSGVVTKFFYDGDSTRVLYETDGGNNIVAQYAYDTSGKLISMSRGGATYYYQFNGHGDVVALTDASGAVINSYDYDAYGNVISKTGSVQNPYLYASYRYDEETGLYYLNARYYAPELGRFITRDSFQGYDTEPASLNQYNYAYSNPVMYTDQEGYSNDYALYMVPGIGKVFLAGSAIYIAGVSIAVSTGSWVYNTIKKYIAKAQAPKIGDLKRLPDSKIKDLGGEGYTSQVKSQTGKSKADLYWNPKTGDVYSIPKSGGPPQWVDKINPR